MRIRTLISFLATEIRIPFFIQIFGSTVFLENLDNGEKINYQIVGKDEADLKQKLIFFQSPIGKGLIGKNKGDLVEIKTPAGIKNFEIKDVKYI